MKTQGSLRQNSMYSKRCNIASGSEIGQTAALYTEISVINAKINCTQIYKSQNTIQKFTRPSSYDCGIQRKNHIRSEYENSPEFDFDAEIM
jgi:hypothetical protein